MDSQTESPAERDEPNATPRRPRFQYSLKTLLWFMTGCAIVSAVLGWIGPEWGLFFLVGSPHIAAWGWLVTKIALRMIRNHQMHATIAPGICAVVWAVAIYFIVFSGMIFGAEVVRLVWYSWHWEKFFSWVAGVLSAEFMFAMFLLIATICALVASLSVSVFVSLVLIPWGVGPRVFASLLGGAVGSLAATFVVSNHFLMGYRRINYAPQWFFGLILPITMGFVLPPLLIAWADRLGRIRPYHDTLDAPPPEEIAAAMRAADRGEHGPGL